jgi:ubiquinone/menaquinone biosynthesis C-methylase UbiE
MTDKKQKDGEYNPSNKLRAKILEYWNRNDVESMYDKHILNSEIELIKQHIQPNSKILDAGCGEGEGTIAFSRIPEVFVHATDFSDTRIRMARQRLERCKNVILKKVDFLKKYSLDNDYDIVISQRFLINLPSWNLQKKVLSDLMTMLKIGGKLVVLEGCKQGVDSLNEFREVWGLNPIPVKWHNLFLDDNELKMFMRGSHFDLIKEDGIGVYFFLTRGIRPILDEDLNWDSEFNRIAAFRKNEELLGFRDRFSRLKLWVFQKRG